MTQQQQPHPSTSRDLFYKYHPEKPALLEHPTDLYGDPPIYEPIGTAYAYHNQPINSGMINFGLAGTVKNGGTPEGVIANTLERKLLTLKDKIRKLQNEREWIQCATTIMEQTPIDLNPKGVAFIDQVLSHETKVKIESIHWFFSVKRPIGNQDPIGNQPTRFRVTRDHHREFSSDGRAFLITSTSTSTDQIIGLIDPMTCHLLFRSQPCTQFLSIVKIIEAIGTDPRRYFSESGKKCGLCLFCNRPLSDTESIANGYGKICGHRFLSQQT